MSLITDDIRRLIDEQLALRTEQLRQQMKADVALEIERKIASLRAQKKLEKEAKKAAKATSSSSTGAADAKSKLIKSLLVKKSAARGVQPAADAAVSSRAHDTGCVNWHACTLCHAAFVGEMYAVIV